MKKLIFILMFGMFMNLLNIQQNRMFSQDVNNTTAFDVEAAKTLIASLFLNERWTNTLSNLQSVNLPVGMQRTVRGVEYILAVTKLEFHPMGTRMNLLLSITTPYRDDELNRLYFYAENVSWSEKGGFSDENVRLALLDDFHIPLGKNMEILLKKAINDKGTFAEIDCHGLKFLSLDASLIFDNSLVIPADCDSAPCSKLTADFSMNIETWSDLIVNINLPDFQVPTLKGWTFQAENVVFDFSENRKSAIAKLPQNYIQTYFPNDENIWRGVFIESLKVTLPEYFEGHGRFAFQAQSLIIDDVGVTGMLSAQNVIPQGLAHVGGWGLSMDTLGLDFFANRLKSGYLGGLMHLPVMDSGLQYFGKIFENNRFLMQVNLSDTVQFDCWKTASVKLNKESFVKIELVEKRFLAQAFLHGAMSFDFSSKGADPSSLLHVPNIEFQNLVLQNHKPYLSVGQLSYDGSIGFSGFPAQIDEIEVQAGDENALNLRCVASVGLTSANDGAFRGETGFTIHSHLEKTDQRHKLVYEKFSIEKVSINADNHAFSLNGNLIIFENDSLYGQGFSGNVELKIKQPTITVKTAATFGKTSNFRYWFADGLVNFGKAGIPIFAGLSINGFAGGAYQRMKPSVQKSKSQIGVSSSGIQYVPNDSIKLGIQASVSICAQSNPSVFNGEAGLELAFNASGGLNFIQFKGVATVAQELSGGYMEKLKKNVELLGSMDKNMQEKLRKETEKDAAVTACMTLNYDFNNNVFRGLFDANLSAPLLSGKGQAELYLASGKWYFHVGHPDRRCYVKIGVGNISISTGMYLMAGHDIPAMPRPPAEIRHLISGSDFSKLENSRDVFAVNLGRGFAFGSDFAMNTGDLRFLVFFAQFQARLGFDFALKDYGNFSCAQSSSPIGLNGWYGTGQAYAYLAGKIGIDVKIFRRRKQFTILDAQVGTLLQAQLPNPAWFAGNLATNYNILNGLVKGHCNFKFELGQKCELPQLSEMDNLAVITDLKPSENETDVNVYALPQAAFSLPVKEFRTNEKENYKIQMESFTLKHGNAALTGDLEWNEDFTSVIFSPHEILPHQTNLKASVTLGFYEKINNEWKPLRDDKNQIQKEILSQTFTTGERPKTLPVSEVLYSYPVIEQQNFYPQEWMNGYIQLNRNHGFLFEDENYEYKIRFISTHGTVAQPLTYNTAQKQIQWTMPKLNAQTDYTLKIVGEPRNPDENFSNVSENYNTENLDSDGNTTEIRENTLSETATDNQIIEIFSYTFRTGKYATFAEAVQSLGPLNTKLQTLLTQEDDEQYYSIPDANYLFAHCNKTADFDEAELFGTRYTQGKTLIKAEAILDAQNIYFADHIHPLIYAPYNFDGLVQLPRNAGQSLLPTWAMMPLDLSANSKMFPWTYDVPLVYKSDLQKIQVQLADQHTRGKDISQYASILSKSLPFPVYGTYRFTLQYRLPCGTLGTSYTSFFNYTK